MIRQLPFVIVFAALGATLQAWGSEPEVTSIIRFADPADAMRITVAKAGLSGVSGTHVNGGGIAAQVEFELADWPELLIRPTEQPADWSGVRALAIPIDNPTANPIDLLVRVDDDPHADVDRHSLTGRARVRSGEAGVLILPLPTNDALPMGMVAGPPAEAPRLDAFARVIRGARGAVDPRHVTAIHLILLRRSSGRTLIFGDLGIIHGAIPVQSPSNRSSTVLGNTPAPIGMVGSNEDLQRARAQEEQEVQEWLPPALGLDRYGGLMEGPDFHATGFFRTERRNGRWRLVTPDGHAFFSLGIDVVSPDVGATFVEGREFMFAELPDPSDPLATHYGYMDERRGLPVQRGRQYDHGRSFDFYAANLQRKYRADYLPVWRGTALERLRAWGFNTIGDWSEPRLLERHEMPYVVPIHIYGNFTRVSSGSDWWGKMPDSFDPAFAAAVDAFVEKAASTYRHDPYLIGYFVDNELAWARAMPRTRSSATALQWRRYGSGGQPGKAGLCRSAHREISGRRTSRRGVGHRRAFVG